MKLDLDINYIAGFVDGEGCIYMNSQGSKLDTKLTITNTNLEVLEDIQSYFGCGRIRIKKRTFNKLHHKTCYILDFWAQEAQNVLEQLYPYLRQKQEQAKLVLECRKICKDRVSYSKGRIGMIPLSEDEKNIRLQYVNKVKELKHG